ncbi:hypothetical protein PLESTF_000664100 [Pleodorina starrii]|nr:hypothetical protein PLESTF_000664100 [Pleodorina starrii]
MIFESSPAIITMITHNGVVLHQNLQSKRYLGDRVMPTEAAADESYEDVLALIFALDPDKRRRMMEELYRTGSVAVWKAVVRVPYSLNRDRPRSPSREQASGVHTRSPVVVDNGGGGGGGGSGGGGGGCSVSCRSAGGRGEAEPYLRIELDIGGPSGGTGFADGGGGTNGGERERVPNLGIETDVEGVCGDCGEGIGDEMIPMYRGQLSRHPSELAGAAHASERATVVAATVATAIATVSVAARSRSGLATETIPEHEAADDNGGIWLISTRDSGRCPRLSRCSGNTLLNTAANNTAATTAAAATWTNGGPDTVAGTWSTELERRSRSGQQAAVTSMSSLHALLPRSRRTSGCQTRQSLCGGGTGLCGAPSAMSGAAAMEDSPAVAQVFSASGLFMTGQDPLATARNAPSPQPLLPSPGPVAAGSLGLTGDGARALAGATGMLGVPRVGSGTSSGARHPQPRRTISALALSHAHGPSSARSSATLSPTIAAAAAALAAAAATGSSLTAQPSGYRALAFALSLGTSPLAVSYPRNNSGGVASLVSSPRMRATSVFQRSSTVTGAAAAAAAAASTAANAILCGRTGGGSGSVVVAPRGASAGAGAGAGASGFARLAASLPPAANSSSNNEASRTQVAAADSPFPNASNRDRRAFSVVLAPQGRSAGGGAACCGEFHHIDEDTSTDVGGASALLTGIDDEAVWRRPFDVKPQRCGDGAAGGSSLAAISCGGRFQTGGQVLTPVLREALGRAEGRGGPRVQPSSASTAVPPMADTGVVIIADADQSPFCTGRAAAAATGLGLGPFRVAEEEKNAQKPGEEGAALWPQQGEQPQEEHLQAQAQQQQQQQQQKLGREPLLLVRLPTQGEEDLDAEDVLVLQEVEEEVEGDGDEVLGPQCWHEVWATSARDPVTGDPVIVLTQMDVTGKVIAERHLALVMETEHRLVEQLFPRHILQYITEEWTSTAEGAGGREAGGGGVGAGGGGAGGQGDGAVDGGKGNGGGGGSLCWRPVIRDCNALATSHAEVTLLFADIKGFTPMCKEVEPRQVMSLLNSLYSRYDAMLDTYGVYKVETIGDCYFVAGGLIHEDEDGMAAAMLSAASEVLMPTSGSPVEIRIGLHTGPVVSGVVGTRMPRFCLFGDTVNTASRMESTGLPGAIHASEATFRKLAAVSRAGWEATGGIEVKGKGLMQTYVWRPRRHDEVRRDDPQQQQQQQLMPPSGGSRSASGHGSPHPAAAGGGFTAAAGGGGSGGAVCHSGGDGGGGSAAAAAADYVVTAAEEGAAAGGSGAGAAGGSGDDAAGGSASRGSSYGSGRSVAQSQRGMLSAELLSTQGRNEPALTLLLNLITCGASNGGRRASYRCSFDGFHMREDPESPTLPSPPPPAPPPSPPLPSSSPSPAAPPVWPDEHRRQSERQLYGVRDAAAPSSPSRT